LGEVYGFGYNKNREIGVGNIGNQLIPVLTKGLDSEPIKAISCGDFHCLALIESGQLLFWGAFN
jgi:alpha-tubulin suppressor-like RCC1 family protein